MTADRHAARRAVALLAVVVLALVAAFTFGSPSAVADTGTLSGTGVAAFNRDRQPISITSPGPDSSYTRDALGRITERVETTNGATHTLAYSYSPAGHLTDVRRDGTLIETYAYDTAGNPTTRTRSGATTTATYDDQDRLVSLGEATYTYSPAGRLASVATPSGATTYDYDATGALTGVTLASGARVDYVIDPAGRRVAKKLDGALVEGYVYEGARLVATTDATATITARFVYTTHTTTPTYLERDGRKYRIVSDHLGSPRVVLDANSGAVAQRVDYDSFGAVTSDTNEGFTPFGFAGGLYDPTTGLVRFSARDYDANAARWTAKDPAGFAGGDTSLYAYAGGDPVNLVDTSGLGFKLPGFVHTALDVVGVIPVIGDAVDVVHAGIYLAEGDCLNAAISLAAVIPIAGSAALGARYALKYGDEALGVGRFADEAVTTGRTASTSWGRTVQDFEQYGDQWRRVSAHAEAATARTYRGGTSIEEVFERGTDRLVRHRIYGPNGEILHETFRPDAKFGAP